MKRKFLSLFLALVLLVSASAPVFAADCRCAPSPACTLLRSCLRLLTVSVHTPEPSAVAEPLPIAQPEPASPAPAAEPIPAEEPVPAEAPAPVSPPQPALTTYEQQLTALVNVRRAEAGLSPLTLDDAISSYARVKAQDLHDGGYFAHESPTYGSPFDMMRSFGISYRYAGENIAMGYADPASVMAAWMQSEGHRANILSDRYTTLGVGYVADGGYWVQWFIG